MRKSLFAAVLAASLGFAVPSSTSFGQQVSPPINVSLATTHAIYQVIFRQPDEQLFSPNLAQIIQHSNTSLSYLNRKAVTINGLFQQGVRQFNNLSAYWFLSTHENRTRYSWSVVFDMRNWKIVYIDFVQLMPASPSGVNVTPRAPVISPSPSLGAIQLNSAGESSLFRPHPSEEWREITPLRQPDFSMLSIEPTTPVKADPCIIFPPMCR